MLLWYKQGFYDWTHWKDKNREKKIPFKLSLLEKTLIPRFENSSIFIIVLCKLCVLEKLEFEKIAKSISVGSKYWTFLPEKDKTFWDLPYF